MMSISQDKKERVPDLLRYILWEAYNRQCFYTTEKVALEDLHIDHILPRYLWDHLNQLEEIKRRLSLPADFTLNSLENLAPTSWRVNRDKSNRIFTDEALIRHLGRSIEMGNEVRKWKARFEKDGNYLRHLYWLHRFKSQQDNVPEKVYDFLTDNPDRKEYKRLTGNPLELSSGRVALSCFVPELEGSGRLHFSALVTLREVTLRGALITFGPQDILESLFSRAATPFAARSWVIGSTDGNRYLLQLAHVRCSVLQVEAERLAEFCDSIGMEAWDRAKQVEKLWQTTDFEPGGGDVWHLLKIKRELWDLLLNFAQAHDIDRGESSWHIFNANGAYLNTMAKPREGCGLIHHCVLIPRPVKDDFSFLPSLDDVWVCWSRQYFQSETGSFSNLAAATASEAYDWLTQKLIPTALEWQDGREKGWRTFRRPLPPFQLERYGCRSTGFQEIVLKQEDGLKEWTRAVGKVQSYFNCRPHDAFPSRLLEKTAIVFQEVLALLPPAEGKESYMQGNFGGGEKDLCRAADVYCRNVLKDHVAYGFGLDLMWRNLFVLLDSAEDSSIDLEKQDKMSESLAVLQTVLDYVNQERYRERLITMTR